MLNEFMDDMFYSIDDGGISLKVNIYIITQFQSNKSSIQVKKNY